VWRDVLQVGGLAMQKIFLCPIFFAVAMLQCFFLHAGFNFASKESGINLVGGKLAMSTAVQSWDGTLTTSSERNLTSGQINFNAGRLLVNNVPALISGRLQAAVAQQLQLLGSQTMRVEAGPLPARLYVNGSGNRFEGQPVFSNDSVAAPNITIDTGADLTISMQNLCNGYVSLNNSTLILDDHFVLADGKEILGTGSIVGNNKSFAFGGSDMALTGTINIMGPTQIVLNANTRLSSKWQIGSSDKSKQVSITGNGNVLDLSLGGTLSIGPGVSVALSNIKIKGIGKGGIAFGNTTSQLRLSDVQLELASNYTVTTGNIYIDGSTTIVTKDKFLTFSNKGSLTVDGTTFWYDAAGYQTNNNIKPARTFVTNGTNANICLKNGGRIKDALGETFDNVTIENPGAQVATKDLFLDIRVTGSSKLLLSQNTIIDGGGRTMVFSSEENTIVLPKNKWVSFKNVTLQDFSPQHVTNAQNQSVRFGENTIIKLAPTNSDIINGAIQLNNRWFFGGQGNILLDGQDNTLDISSNVSALSLISTGTMTIQNMKIYGAGGVANYGNIRSLNRHGTINLKGVELILTGDYEFFRGYLNIYPDVVLRGVGKKFSYISEYPLSIGDSAILTLDYGMTFSYDSRDRSALKNQHLKFATDSSTLYLNGSTLHATPVGLQIARGTIFANNIVTFASEGNSLDNGLVIAPRVNTHVLAAATLRLDGKVVLE
jgi:hypothetical protein